MKRSLTWLVFVAIIILVCGLFVGIKFLMAPLEVNLLEEQGVKVLFGGLPENVARTAHYSFSDGIVRHVYFYSDGHVMVQFESAEHRGIRLWWCAFDKAGAVTKLFPESSLLQSSLYKELGFLVRQDSGAFELDEIDALTGATIDRDLLYKSLEGLPAILEELKEGMAES